MKRSLTIALFFGAVATIGFCLAVWIRNLVYQPSLLTWQIPLNAFTFPGLLASTLLFSCQPEGLEIGCEWHRMFPTFVTVNALTFAAISFPLVHLFRSFWRKGPTCTSRKALKILIDRAEVPRK
jgi:hypothetical protein